MTWRLGYVTPWVALFLLPAHLQAEPPGDNNRASRSAVEIARWIEELGDTSFAKREAASQMLRALANVPEALKRAVKSPSPEVAHRAKAIVKHIDDRNFDARI